MATLTKLAAFLAAAAITTTASAQTTVPQYPDSIVVDSVGTEVSLGEATIKGTLPRTRVKGDAMRTTIAGTILEKAGSATDALDRVPTLSAKEGGNVEVAGRGAAEIYINGRKVMDPRELDRLRSDQIQSVDVVQNPGARYAATTKAVVRITLKKAQGEGFSFMDNLSYIYRYNTTLHDNLDINYRRDGLDITASMWGGRFGSRTLSTNELTYIAGPDHVRSFMDIDQGGYFDGYSPQLQVNYQVNANHSFGAFYKLDNGFRQHMEGTLNTDSYLSSALATAPSPEEVLLERSESELSSNVTTLKHIFNGYYSGRFGKLGVDFTTEGQFDSTDDNNETNETTLHPSMPDTHRSVKNFNDVSNSFAAAKLIFSYPVWKGNLSFGTEYSYNNRTDSYTYESRDGQGQVVMLPVKTSDNELRENAAAGFVEFGRTFGRLYAQAGVRYEHLNNDYFSFGQKQDDVCRTYSDFFPSATLAMPVGKVQMMLSYRRDIQRPAYQSLSNSTFYLNAYTFQRGNPYLQPTFTHSIVYNAAYKSFNLMLNYSRVEGEMTVITEPFFTDASAADYDPLVSLLHPVNSPAYNRLFISPSYRPSFGCWHPVWQANLMLQDYSTTRADGSTIKLNSPYLFLSWYNDITLPWQLRLTVYASYHTKGDMANTHVTRQTFSSFIGLQREFTTRHAGNFNIDLRLNDPFSSNATETLVYGPREIKAYAEGHRSVQATLTWKFNEARSKYKGQGAGASQKARM